MANLGSRIIAAYRAFLNPDPIEPGKAGGDWCDVEARRRRYRLLWAFYQQEAFADRSVFSGVSEGAYRAIRDVFGVAYQLGEFWAGHLHGGNLDPLAGDGSEAPTCLPILVGDSGDDLAIREGLAELWKRSNWGIHKDVLTRMGAVQGDVFGEACDDADAMTIRLNVVQPGHVKDCAWTAEGNLTFVHLDYMRDDPRPRTKDERARKVRYEEIVETLPGGRIRRRVYLDGGPAPASTGWVADYTYAREELPFVPWVKIQHRNIGLGWGLSEIAPAVGGMREVADLASCLTDWSRRVLNSPMLLAGVKNPASRPGSPDPVVVRQQQSVDEYANSARINSSDPIRQELPFVFAPEGARAYTLTDPLPVDGIGSQIDRLRAKLIEDYPELAFEKTRLSGDASGESFREARKPAEDKIRARRAEYDHGCERLFKMALTLGGLRGYEHYRGFTLDSYANGSLDFRIGDRPAFALTEADKIADRLAKYGALKAAVDAGLPLEMAMREAGYDDKAIDEAVAMKERADAAAAERQRLIMDGAEEVGEEQ